MTQRTVGIRKPSGCHGTEDARAALAGAGGARSALQPKAATAPRTAASTTRRGEMSLSSMGG